MADFTWETGGSDHEFARLRRALEPLDRFYGVEPVVIRRKPPGKAAAPTGGNFGDQTDAAPRVYRPLEDVPDLALRFKNLGEIGADWLGFAKDYGLLGLDSREGGELRAEWAEQIQAVGKVFLLWDTHEGNIAWEQARYSVDDVPQVVKLPPERVAEVAVKTTADGQRYLDLDNPEWHEFPRETTKPSLRARLDAFQSDAARWRVLRPQLRQQIADIVNPNLYRSCGTGFAFSSKGKAAWMTHQPRSLLGAIWLQVVWHLTGERRFRECARRGCGKWFVISTEKEGRKQRYCGNRCRTAACRARSKAQRERTRKGRR